MFNLEPWWYQSWYLPSSRHRWQDAGRPLDLMRFLILDYPLMCQAVNLARLATRLGTTNTILRQSILSHGIHLTAEAPHTLLRNNQVLLQPISNLYKYFLLLFGLVADRDNILWYHRRKLSHLTMWFENQGMVIQCDQRANYEACMNLSKKKSVRKLKFIGIWDSLLLDTLDFFALHLSKSISNFTKEFSIHAAGRKSKIPTV
jgi:hypothetical protein